MNSPRTLISRQKGETRNRFYITSRAYIKYVRGGPEGFEIFQKKFCSPGDHRPEYFLAQ